MKLTTIEPLRPSGFGICTGSGEWLYTIDLCINLASVKFANDNAEMAIWHATKEALE